MQVGIQSGGGFQRLNADLTLASRYRYDGVVRVDFRIEPGALRRDQTAQLGFKAPPAGEYSLPERSFADVTQGTIDFSTDYYSREVRSPGSQRDDLVDPLTGGPTSEGGRLDFPLSSYETEVFRDRLTAGLDALRKELEENIYRYHKIIWWNLDQDELYTQLDGFTISASDNCSIASVVERQPLGILGNSLVFRVAAGSGVDPNFETSEALLGYYRDGLPQSDPMRVSLPTSGLYARAHMDACNACEEHQGSQDWVLSDPDPQLADLPATLLGSRRAEVRDLAPSPFPETLINLQNAPGAPAPTGLGGALTAVTTSNAFRDMASLQGTQQLANQGLQTAASLATSFGANATAVRLAELEADKTAGQKLSDAADAAQRAVQKGQMDEADARSFVRDFANRLANGDDGGNAPGAAGGTGKLGEQARALASELGPKGAATLVESGPKGVSVASFDSSGLLAQAGGRQYIRSHRSGLPGSVKTGAEAGGARTCGNLDDPEHRAPACARAIQRIGQLYAVEKEARGAPPDRRVELRQAKATPVFDELEAWLAQQLTRISGKSPLASAIRYTLARMRRMRPYLGNGILELDNNVAERGMRAIALGRKNYLFVGSEAGGKAAATSYTLIETAKLNGVDPHAWLADTLARIPDYKITKVDELLPWRWKAKAMRRRQAMVSGSSITPSRS